MLPVPQNALRYAEDTRPQHLLNGNRRASHAENKRQLLELHILLATPSSDEHPPARRIAPALSRQQPQAHHRPLKEPA